MSVFPANRQSSESADCRAILIFGASARAAVQSAVRAGLEPIAADLFGDVDLCAAADFHPLREYPGDFIRVAQSVSTCPWMYTGGLENYPKIVGAISSQRRLWGNDEDVLRSVRDPAQLTDLMQQNGLPTAFVRAEDDPPPRNDEWLLKPLGGAGGSGITVWNGAVGQHPTRERPHFFQQRVAGKPVSALYLANRRKVHLIGVTRQFVGTRSLGASPYSYCGSLGPLPLSAADRHTIAEVGQVVGRQFELRGLFGVDFVRSPSAFVPLEINPRYVASAEILEQALDVPLLDWQRRSCETFHEPSNALLDREVETALRSIGRQRRGFSGKAILFALADVLWPDADGLRTILRSEGSRLADIPQPGTTISVGRPICTILSSGDSENRCLVRLGRAIRLVKQFATAFPA